MIRIPFMQKLFALLIILWAGSLSYSAPPAPDSLPSLTDSAVSITAVPSAKVDSLAVNTVAPITAAGPWQRAFSDQNIPFIGILVMLLLLISIILLNMRNLSLASQSKERHRASPGAIGMAMRNLDKFASDNLKWWFWGTIGFFILYLGYFFVQGSLYESHVVEWLNLLVRWAHVIFGVAWIGTSFYFNFLEHAIDRGGHTRDEIAGDLWALHGGGFYYLEKYKVAPQKLPEKIHWFKYEAYFTWITGFCLLAVVYYLNAKNFLIDPDVMQMSNSMAIAISVCSMIAAWLIYDALCKSSLGAKPVTFALVGFLITTIFGWFFTEIFSSRAAYMHVGVILGTCMAANVFRVIIPSQKAMVRAAEKGETVDPGLGQRALQRSLHNNYITLPVLFIMVSNHFPSTFGNEWNWLVLAGISLGGALVRHYFNLKDKGRNSVWILPIASIAIIAMAIVTAPKDPSKIYEGYRTISFSEVNSIIASRCQSCHSSYPTDDYYAVAPNGVKFETPQEITGKSDLIWTRAVVTKNMPQNNKTDMTVLERQIIGAWIMQGKVVE